MKSWIVYPERPDKAGVMLVIFDIFGMRDLARAMPQARLAEVPDAGHIVNLGKPKVFNEILGSFLREVAA